MRHESLRAARLHEKACVKCARLMQCLHNFPRYESIKGIRWGVVCYDCIEARYDKHFTPLSLEVAARRFWLKVDKGPSCWDWLGGQGHDGYGSFRATPAIVLSAHKFSKLLDMNVLSLDECCLHTCDNRLCVNPAHLFLGSRIENNADRNKKERQARGERCGTAKLTMLAIQEIRAATEKHSIIAQRYGIAACTVSAIKLRYTWKHVA